MRKAKVSSTLSGTNFMPTKPIPEDLRTRPIKLTDNARVVLQKRYVRRGEDGKPAETEQEMFWRVAYHVALAEAEFDEDVEKYARLFYELLTNLEFFPNSPTFTGAGTPLGQLAACFVLAIDDDMGRTESGIFQTLRDAALIQQTGGGNGFAFSRLRPKGAIVKSSRGEATGPVGFLRVYDQAFGEIAQGGCLLPDTLVFTDQGLLRLDEIVHHTERGWQSHHLTVATDEGVRRSTNAYNNGVVPVLKITTDAGIELTGTPNHKVKTNHGWQQFDQLEQGDTILVQLRGFIHANPEQTLKTDQGATPFNAETAYQLGYFMGGGSLDPQTRQLFSKNALTDAQGCALTAIPRIVRQSPVHVIKAFLKGLHKAAAYSSVYAQVVLRSPQLAQEVAVLLIGLGFPAFVVPQPEGVLVSLEAPVLEQVGLPTATKTSYVGRERYWPTPFGDADLADFDGRFVWEVKVASVTPAGEALTLDIEVEDNHTYLANGLVTHNSRRGANMAVLKVSHPDIRDFVTCKSNESQITNFNISVGMTDEFMRAVEGDEDFQLVNPVDGNVWETVRARDLFDLIVQQAHHNGEPGVLFLDAANRANPVPHLYELESTNPCFIGSTRVATDQGLIPIQYLAENGTDFMVATDNRAPLGGVGTVKRTAQGVAFRHSSPAWKTRENTPVMKLVTKHGNTVTATPDHKFLTLDKGYVELRSLKVGDTLLLQSGEGAWSKNYALPNVEVVETALATMAQGGDHASGHVVSRKDFAAQYASVPTQWSHELGMVMGWLVGDGWLSPKSASPVGMVFGTEKDEAQEIIHTALRTWFGDGHLHDRGAVQQLTYGRLPYRFFSALGVKAAKAHEKRVPDSIWTAPREAVIGFLQGLFTADGTVNYAPAKKSCSIRLASSSKGLLEDVQLLLTNLGIASKLHHRRAAGSRMMPDGKGGRKAYLAHDDYELLIDKANRDVFLDKVGFLNTSKQNRAQAFLDSKVRRSNAESFETTVVSVEDAGTADVYDLTEEHTHSLITNGLITHNCGEQYLGPFENCCLGSINLAKLNIIDGKPDWDHFQRMIETATRFLDDVVSANSYVPAVPQLAQAAHRVRRIGLGVMGLGDLMYKIGVRYGSEEGQEFAGQISEFLRYHAMKTSIDLAKERGAFPAIEGSLYDPENLKWRPPTPLKPYTRDWDRPSLDWEKIVNRIKKHGIRNGAQCTVAPTGTIATVSGCEAYGCEPVFALAYIRHVNDKGQDLQLQYTSPLLQKALEKAGLNSDQIKHIVEQVNHDGTCQNISDLPESIRHTFVVSSDITAEEHIYMQAAMQRFIDNAISKTCNFPAGATAEDVKQAYILGWKLGCKGLTVYVTGSRDKVVLETHATAKAKEGKPDEAQPAVVQAAPEIAVTTAQVTVEPKHDAAAHMPRLYPTENNKRERPRRLVGQTFRVGTPLGATYVTVNENGDGKGQPFEVFIHTAKAGSETAAIAEAIGRLISLVLRMKSPLEPRMRLKEIIDQLEGIGGGRATGFGPARVRSLPDGVSQALQEYVEVTDSVEVEVVPSTLARLDQPAAHTHDNGASASATPHVAEAKTPVKAGVIVGDLCPECGEASVVNEEGCRKCYSCGYSEC